MNLTNIDRDQAAATMPPKRCPVTFQGIPPGSNFTLAPQLAYGWVDRLNRARHVSHASIVDMARPAQSSTILYTALIHEDFSIRKTGMILVVADFTPHHSVHDEPGCCRDKRMDYYRKSVESRTGRRSVVVMIMQKELTTVLCCAYTFCGLQYTSTFARASTFLDGSLWPFNHLAYCIDMNKCRTNDLLTHYLSRGNILASTR